MKKGKSGDATGGSALRLATPSNVVAADKTYQFVDNEFPPSTNDIRPLDEVLQSINTSLESITQRKRIILQELYYLHQHWDYYTKLPELKQYAGESGLYRFLTDRINQGASTSHADVKITRMLSIYRKGHLLTLENRVGALRRIAYISNRRSPDSADQFRKQLLDELPKLNNQQVTDRIEQYNRDKGEPVMIKRKSSRPYELAINPARGKVLIKDMSEETAKEMGKLLQFLTPEKIKSLLVEYEREVSEDNLQSRRKTG